MKRLALLILIVAPFAMVGWSSSAPRVRSHSGLSPRWHSLRSRTDVHRVQPIEVESRVIEVKGLPKATTDRAREDARNRLNTVLAPWLSEAGIPGDWTPPSRLVDELVESTTTREDARDYGTVYITTTQIDLSESRREPFVQAYRRDVAGRRLLTLGEILGFVLVCLGIVTGYIRADEATRGYYTGPLRLVAVGGLGLAGFALLRMLA